MRKTILYLFSFLSAFILLTFISCDDKDNSSPLEIEPIQKSKLNGFIEKGPFANGSDVSIWELDANLSQTGKSFSATTNNEGFFEINNAMDFASSYVKLSVNGYYFNEIRGDLSSSRITLEAIADIKEKNSINANLITHLEYKRVLHLINKEKKNFAEAKKQAGKELLACFLIKDKEIIPEAASITDNNTQANILIAISSILLNAVEYESAKDAKFTELINNFRDDFEKDGAINDDLKEIIKGASYRLDYVTVKNNIEHRYQELDKNVTVGNFHYFIDGDNDGILADEDYDIVPKDNIDDGPQFTDEDFKLVITDVLQEVSNATKQVYLFDALFTNSIEYYSTSYSLDDIYNHQISSSNSWVNDLYGTYYKAIQRTNLIIEKAEKEEFAKYRYTSMIYRAYCYLTMVELWGDVPLVTKTLNINDDMYLPRAPRDEVYQFIVNELKEAEKHLPEEGDYMICSKHLASALLARTYLQQARFSEALSAATRIMESNKYQLASNYNDIFKPANKETFFSFIANDGDDPTFNQLIRKGQETPMIRYAEILLIAAEANLNLNQYNKAIELINQVRVRNNRTQLSEGASTDDIRNTLLEEWEKDLIKEGAWFFALKRFGMAESTLQIPEYMTLLPIPQREIDLNHKMAQNPGY